MWYIEYVYGRFQGNISMTISHAHNEMTLFSEAEHVHKSTNNKRMSRHWMCF
jgi:hypothetical protein